MYVCGFAFSLAICCPDDSFSSPSEGDGLNSPKAQEELLIFTCSCCGKIVLCSGERLSACSRRGAELPGDAGPWFKRRCGIWIMSLSALSPFKYSVLQFHPWGGCYAWLLPSASALSVAWELLHCSVSPPAPLPHSFLWLMVGYIYIFFQQCCGASESPPLQDREKVSLG